MGCICGSNKGSQPAATAKKQKNIILQSDMVRKVVNHDIKDDYKFLAVLGEGGFGEVKRAIHKITNIDRAVKMLRKNSLAKDGQDKLMREVALVREMDHPNALKMIEYYDDPYCFYIVDEAYTGGTLYEKWINGHKFSETKIGGIIRDVLRVINYMHKKSILHRDVKPENIMFASNDPEAHIKLIDYGEASKFTKEKLSKKSGTVMYMAPEVLDGSYNEKCDIWAVGVVLYMLLAGKMPFDAHNEETMIKKIKRAEISTRIKAFEKVSEEAKDLIPHMLDADPAKRYNAQQCLDHPWFEKIVKELSLDNHIDRRVMENVANFKGMSNLKHAFWASIISYFSKYEHTSRIVKTWTALDRKGIGYLTKEDLRRGLELGGQGSKVADIDAIFTALDFNKFGMIQYTGFLNAAFEKSTFLSQSMLESMFKIRDQDSDGYLTIQELNDFLTPDEKLASSPEHVELMKEIEGTHQSKISLAEFEAIVKKHLV